MARQVYTGGFFLLRVVLKADTFCSSGARSCIDCVEWFLLLDMVLRTRR